MDRKAELETQIRYHNEKYYNQDEPEISDFEYDKLVKELRELDPASPVFDELGDATFGSKVAHKEVMGSLLKAHTSEEILKLGHQTIAMPKIDGLACSITYKDGKMVMAVTRGDGYTGEDVTMNVRQIANVPQNLTVGRVSAIKDIEVRGEIYVNNNWFYSNQPNFLTMFGKEFANPRNYASGSLKNKDPKESKKRNLSFVAYRLLGTPVEETKERELLMLAQLGFETPKYYTVDSEAHEVESAIALFTKGRDQFNYDTDGIVFWINDPKIFAMKGSTGKTPNGALAYKFDTEKKESKVKDFEWNTSRTGRVVPVMIIEPIQLAGTTVQRVTMNNRRFIEEKDVVIGDTVLIEKANEIIPKLVAVTKRVTRLTTGNPYSLPVQCTSCGTVLAANDVDLLCFNADCPAQVMSQILHFITTLKIDGFSKGMIKTLADSGILDSKNIFELDETDLRLVGFGPKQAKSFINQLHAVEATPAQFLDALGISGVGESMWEKVLDVVEFDTIVDGQLTEIMMKGVTGSTTKDKILQGLKSKADMIRETLPYIKIKDGKPAPVQGVVNTLAGKKFVITGTLSKKRDDIAAEIEAHGGRMQGGVSTSTDYLVVGDDPGSKLAKARKLGITIIDEDELRKMF